VTAGRMRLLPKLATAVTGFHERIAGTGSLSLRYRSTAAGAAAGGEEPLSEDDVRSRFTESLERVASDERRRGFTLVGPHRDDLEVRLGDRALRTFGSQGQHRTAAIALKLGEAAVLDSDGRGVVVLLDDILSELDNERAASLIELVGQLGQALMTSTRNAPTADTGRNCKRFEVEAGKVLSQ
jgi:DNA replication and repair protein RecF